MIPVIEKRINSLRNAHSAYSLKIQREYLSRNYQNAYEAWQISSNTCFVIFEYIRFLNTVLPSNFVEELPKEEQLQREEDRLLAVNNKIQKEFFSNKIFSKEALDECMRAIDGGMFALMALEEFLSSIRSNLYGLKYHKREKKKYEKYTQE